VVARDVGGLEATATLTVAIENGNDRPEVETIDGDAAVAENLLGARAGKASVKDEDVGQEHRFSIVRPLQFCWGETWSASTTNEVRKVPRSLVGSSTESVRLIARVRGVGRSTLRLSKGGSGTDAETR